MRLFRFIIISFLVLFGLLCLIGALLPSHVRISRAVDVRAPRHAISPFLTDARQWQEWNEFVKNFHQLKSEERHIESTEMKIDVGQAIDSLVTADWMPASGQKFGSGFVIIDAGRDKGQLVVQWYFDFYLRWYPWEKFQSIIYDQQVGPLMEKSLNNLKTLAEKPV
jgi:hypothetical protein